MPKRLIFLLIFLLSTTILFSSTLLASFENLGIKYKDYTKKSVVKVPLITWGADIATIYGNGNNKETAKNSIFAKQGLKLELFREDDFTKQVEEYISGETPYLRGTLGMINMALEVLNNRRETEPIVIYQLSWSAGGDALVVKDNIKSIKDLKGKTIAIQQYGPHVDYLMKLLKDSGVSLEDVDIRWTKNLVGFENGTPAEKFYQDGVDATFVIIPDALALTSNGTVGTGAEDSVKGARILLSTKTANRIINDVYAVRRDYYENNREDVEKFVHGLFLAEERLREIFKNKKSAEYSEVMSKSAKILLDSEQAVADVVGLYYDAEFSRFRGNVKFFLDNKYPRNFEIITAEIQEFLLQLGILRKEFIVNKADWDYEKFKSGLKDVETVEIPKFNKEEVAQIINKRQQQGNIDDGELFSFEIYFKPNQNTFNANLYKDQFEKVIELASTYGGAIITVEGHSDPMGYLRKKQEGASEIILRKIQQAAKNLSLSRSNKVRDEIINYANLLGVYMDISQFATVGYGIDNPKYPIPRTQQQWLDNMRVVFKIIQVEAEENLFVPLDF
ncbi:MAG: ABC transporter substrate-binding protein [Halanaerobiales bacterium]|nr:ABC transporter substrate-binding protein [Halanaerobiales bacterium]